MSWVVKPPPWNFSPGRIAPGWRWFWTDGGGPLLLVPMLTRDTLAFDYVSRKKGTSAGSATAWSITTALYGPFLDQPTDGRWLTWSRSDPGHVDLTFVWVGQTDSGNAEGTVLMGLSDSNASFRLALSQTEDLRLTKGGVADISAGFNVPEDVPVVVLASYRAADGYTEFVVRNLATNAIQTANATNTDNPGVGDGTFLLGGRTLAGGVLGVDGGTGTGYILQSYQPQSRLLQLAMDPWGAVRPMRRRVWKAPAVAPSGSELLQLLHQPPAGMNILSGGMIR